MPETGLGIKDVVVEEAPLSNSGPIPTFREQVFGSEPNIAKFNDEGFFIGASTFASAPFKVTYAGSVTASDLTLTGGTIKAGQTAYNTGTGYWIGTVSGTPKFSIGDGSTKYLTWDGTALTIRGTLNADDIVAGTLTGRTVKAKGTGVSSDVWLDGSIGEVAFYYGGVKIADLYCDTSGRILLDSASQSIYITASSDFYAFGGNSFIVSNSDLNCVFNDNGGSDTARWINDTSLTMEHRDNGDLAISGLYL